MKSLRDEIRLRREIGTDLISSAKQISSEHRSDFIAPRAISLKVTISYDIINAEEVVRWLKTNLPICQQNLQFKS